jgi:nicotinamide-nucleotide amidase
LSAPDTRAFDHRTIERRAQMSAKSISLAAHLGRVLADRKWTVATAESCTGGLIAGAVTDVAGSSAWFDRGFVTYSNEAKIEMLGVRAETLAAHGAVSEATAREMAAGALARSVADIAVAVTGVAGPSGGTPEKPVGLVCFSWARRDGTVEARTAHFAGDRAAVREAAVAAALEGLVSRASAS